MGKVIGIDLGTTFSVIAKINDEGKPEIIPNREGERITPSVVFFDGNEPVVGSIAKRSAVSNPLDTVQFVKRQMGDPAWKFRTAEGKEYTSEEISAIILKRLKEDAELQLNDTILGAVITVPAYFDDARRKATQDAGRIAGLNVLRIINEPTAAALAYGIDKAEQTQTVLVYDLGGGTFDVTIMHVGNGVIEVVATGGDRNLGGFDWDNEVMTFLNNQFKLQGSPDMYDDPALEQILREKAEVAKKTLSVKDKANIHVSAGGKNLSLTITREEFERITEIQIRKTQLIMEAVLDEAKLQWKDIDKILLVGGSTRMPAVATLIEKLTGKKPSRELHLDEVVALGAALQAALLQVARGEIDEEVAGIPEVIIKDVNSQSMGIIALNQQKQEFNAIVLKKNTPIPCKVSKVFHTSSEQQTALNIQVTEGEDAEVVNVKIVGEGTMSIPPYPKGAPVEVFFEYDANGLIHVTVVDLTTKKRLGEMQIKRTSNLSEQMVKARSRELSKMTVN